MKLVCDSADIEKAMRFCPHCGADYTDNFDMDDGDGEYIYSQWICPGCGYQVERVYKCEYVNVWKPMEE